MAFIKGQEGHFFFEVRSLETGELYPGCTFSKTIVYVDGNTDINTSTSPSFDAWSTLNASLNECYISGSASGLWRVSIPTLPNDCETLTFHFVPTAGLNVHVPLVTISLENAPSESTVDLSGLATSAELTSAKNEILAGSVTSAEIGNIPYYVWNYALPSNISSSYVGGLIQTMSSSVNNIRQDMPNAAEISSSVWAVSQRTLTSPVISDSVRLATKDNVADAREYIVSQCATAAGFATPAAANPTKNEILTQCKTAEGFATTEEVASAADLLLSQLATSGALESAKEEILTQCADLPKIHALLGRWSVSGNILTTYDTAGNVLSVHSLTRDGEGNITATQ